MMGRRKKSVMNRIYFETLMVAIKMGKRLRLHIVFYCLSFLFSTLRGSEFCLFWVSSFYFCKITVFITGNASLILQIFNKQNENQTLLLKFEGTI